MPITYRGTMARTHFSKRDCAISSGVTRPRSGQSAATITTSPRPFRRLIAAIAKARRWPGRPGM